MKATAVNVLIGLTILVAALYVLKPSMFSRNEGFSDTDVGGIVGIIVFVLFICFGFMAIATHR